MTPNPLDAIQARADAATEGPWRLWRDPSDSENKRGASVETAWSHDAGGEDTDLITGWCAPADAEFIAHAREDVPRLVKALRAVEAVHRNEHRDHLGRKSETPTERGGFCYGCGWYGGAACPMITAIREALG